MKHERKCDKYHEFKLAEFSFFTEKLSSQRMSQEHLRIHAEDELRMFYAFETVKDVSDIEFSKIFDLVFCRNITEVLQVLIKYHKEKSNP